MLRKELQKVKVNLVQSFFANVQLFKKLIALIIIKVYISKILIILKKFVFIVDLILIFKNLRYKYNKFVLRYKANVSIYSLTQIIKIVLVLKILQHYNNIIDLYKTIKISLKEKIILNISKNFEEEIIKNDMVMLVFIVLIIQFIVVFSNIDNYSDIDKSAFSFIICMFNDFKNMIEEKIKDVKDGLNFLEKNYLSAYGIQKVHKFEKDNNIIDKNIKGNLTREDMISYINNDYDRNVYIEEAVSEQRYYEEIINNQWWDCEDVDINNEAELTNFLISSLFCFIILQDNSTHNFIANSPNEVFVFSYILNSISLSTILNSLISLIIFNLLIITLNWLYKRYLHKRFFIIEYILLLVSIYFLFPFIAVILFSLPFMRYFILIIVAFMLLHILFLYYFTEYKKQILVPSLLPPILVNTDLEIDTESDSDSDDYIWINSQHGDTDSDNSSINNVDLEETDDTSIESDISSINSVDLEENYTDNDDNEESNNNDGSDNNLERSNENVSISSSSSGTDPNSLSSTSSSNEWFIEMYTQGVTLEFILGLTVTAIIIQMIKFIFKYIYKHLKPYIFSMLPIFSITDIEKSFNNPIGFLNKHKGEGKLSPLPKMDEVLIKYVREKYENLGVNTNIISDQKLMLHIQALINDDDANLEKFNWELLTKLIKKQDKMWIHRKPNLNKRDSIDEDYGEIINWIYHYNPFPINYNKPLPKLPFELSTIMEEEEEIVINPKLLKTKLSDLNGQVPETAKTETFPDEIQVIIEQINNNWDKNEQILKRLSCNTNSTYYNEIFNNYDEIFSKPHNLSGEEVSHLANILKNITMSCCIFTILGLNIIDMDLYQFDTYCEYLDKQLNNNELSTNKELPHINKELPLTPINKELPPIPLEKIKNNLYQHKIIIKFKNIYLLWWKNL